MERTVLIYLEKNESFLMMLRNKRKNDFNQGKWIGIGGHIENGETPYDTAIREAREETGFILNKLIPCGLVTFHNIDHDEEMFVFTCNDFTGTLTECNEGTLEWIQKDKLFNLNLWEGDRVFLEPILKNKLGFKAELYYNNDKLIGSEIKYEI